MLFKILCIVLFFQNVNCNWWEEPLVNTNVGVIKGLRADDGNYSMFLGIPYATVDKDNPFGASTPHPKFENVFEAYDDSAMCPQLDPDTNTTKGTLDCLQLNVFTPNSLSSHRLLPVMVFIHGGIFEIGSFSRKLFGPKFLVRHDVVLVTINYRLSTYGFMCLDTPVIPGNQGLKDQLLALKWIQNNIEAFGGDPSEVTLFGQSAGAASIDLFLMYPGPVPFNKAIMNSGSALIPEIIIKSNRTKPILLANYLGCDTSDLNEALRFLATIDTHSVIAATFELGLSFKPCVEKHFKGVQRFIVKHPSRAYRPNVKNMPVLMGSLNRERLGNYTHKDLEYFKHVDVFKERLGRAFDFGNYLDLKSEMVRDFYVRDKILTEEIKWRVTDFDSDLTYIYPVQRPVNTYIRSGARSVHFYVFTYEGRRNLMKYQNHFLDAPGTAHTDDLAYLFDVSFIREKPTPTDQTTIDRMSTMWTNFVKYGDPTPKTSKLLPTPWLPITAKHWNSLQIDVDLDLIGRPFPDRMKFWTEFYRTNGKYEREVNASSSMRYSDSDSFLFYNQKI